MNLRSCRVNIQGPRMEVVLQKKKAGGSRPKRPYSSRDPKRMTKATVQLEARE